MPMMIYIIIGIASSHQKILSQYRFLNQINHFPMGVIFVLICASTTVAAGFLLAFLWAVKQGQFKDDYTPSLRILFEDNIKSNIEDKPINHNKSK